MLVGRREEQARIDRLLDEAAAGRGGALAIRGEPGIGKTALLDYARESGRAATVVATTGVESELELPFAGLADVLRPLVGHLDELPDSQHELVRAALALGPSRPVDRFALGAASLALLAAGAGEATLLVLVDDAHWLDAASRDALLFASRRLGADQVALIFAARVGERVAFEAAGVPALALSGLGHDDAAALLDGVVPADRIDMLVEATQGNPLALLELPATLSEAQLHGQEPVQHPLRVGAGIQRAFARRVLVLGEPTRRALLVAAADDSGDVAAVEAACRGVGAGSEGLLRAEEVDLIRIDGSEIAFRHPLVRAAVYQDAAPSERREVHRALAEVFEGRDEFRHAWHSAAAAAGPNADAASALASVAAESRARGAYAAAAAAFERAARLSPDARERPVLLAHAADSAWLSGRAAVAAALVAEGLAENPARLARGELLACRGRIALYGEDQEAAFETLLEAAQLFEDEDSSRAAELLADAVVAGLQVGGTSISKAAALLGSLEPNDDPVRELLVAQALLAATSVRGDVGGRDRLERALSASERAGAVDESPLHLVWASRGRFMVGHNDEASRLARRAVDSARRTGAFALLPQALRLLASADFDRGRWRSAYAAAGEAVELGRELEQHSTVCACLGLLADVDAAAGNAERCRAHAEAAIEIAIENGLGFYRERAERARGRLELAAGRTAEAIDQLEHVYARLARAGNWEPNVSPAWDLIEAYARAGRLDAARELFARAAKGMPAASPGEEAVIERCAGIVADDLSFESAFERALTLHDSEPFPFERALTEQAYGERLRRAGRRERARELLHAALVAFDELGATAWSSRSRSELAASGERLRSSAVARESLTPREMQVALAVAEGASNNEVAAALYLTPKTVEYHLTRVYRKLGLRSRAELAREFARRDESRRQGS
jgi:DNA-binding CsgD family transcriptional regulator